MTPQLWLQVVGMVASAFAFVAATVGGAAWYLATRLGKQDTKIGKIETMAVATRDDVAFLRAAKEEERGKKPRVVRPHGWGILEGRGNGHADDDE